MNSQPENDPPVRCSAWLGGDPVPDNILTALKRLRNSLQATERASGLCGMSGNTVTLDIDTSFDRMCDVQRDIMGLMVLLMAKPPNDQAHA